MKAARTPVSSRLDAAARRLVERSVERVRQDGQTRWLARVDAAPDAPALDWYAQAAERDRFLWEAGDSEDFSVAVGVSHEIESAGPERFCDVRAWAEDTRARIDWIGESREASRATFFGGFGFEPESRGAAEWKAFPAARFVLPEWIAERVDGEMRCISIARVEPGASVSSIEADLLARRALFDLCASAGEAHADSNHDTDTDTDSGCPGVGWPASPDSWESGPEYRVRSDRSHGVFRAQIEDALAAVGRGELAKVVLARSLSVDYDGEVDLIAFLARLRALYPTCTLVAMGRGADTFLAATPETLVRVRSGRVETAALAGSAPRGRTPEEDEVLARGLLENPKERAEHAHVVEAIRDVLEAACESVEIPEAPVLRRLFGIQHLETPIRASLGASNAATGGAPVDALGLVDALHPTPAVCGVPRAEAQAWLARSEGLDRGWYAAPIGWLDSEGGGDFRVALRSALVRNGLAEGGRFGSSRALLFAGAGLVEGSDPEQELVETRIKLRALLAPLTEI